MFISKREIKQRDNCLSLFVKNPLHAVFIIGMHEEVARIESLLVSMGIPIFSLLRQTSSYF
jgi:hypothetical protein